MSAAAAAAAATSDISSTASSSSSSSSSIVAHVQNRPKLSCLSVYEYIYALPLSKPMTNEHTKSVKDYLRSLLRYCGRVCEKQSQNNEMHIYELPLIQAHLKHTLRYVNVLAALNYIHDRFAAVYLFENFEPFELDDAWFEWAFEMEKLKGVPDNRILEKLASKPACVKLWHEILGLDRFMNPRTAKTGEVRMEWSYHKMREQPPSLCFRTYVGNLKRYYPNNENGISTRYYAECTFACALHYRECRLKTFEVVLTTLFYLPQDVTDLCQMYLHEHDLETDKPAEESETSVDMTQFDLFNTSLDFS